MVSLRIISNQWETWQKFPEDKFRPANVFVQTQMNVQKEPTTAMEWLTVTTMKPRSHANVGLVTRVMD